MVNKASKAAKAGKTIHLVGRADQAEIVKQEMIREGAPASAIVVAREPVKALPKVDSLSDTGEPQGRDQVLEGRFDRSQCRELATCAGSRREVAKAGP